ncbi:MAG: lycopene cyclase domain-containing protein [Spirochaetales bacterium]|nr:lycopene cyclase domain-containing protein [Spirochaetales bacterium]
MSAREKPSRRTDGMTYYTLLVLAVVAAPLALSFDKKVAFYRQWPAVFRAIAVVLVVFGAWDVWKTAAGIWSFNDDYAGTWRFLGLPLGEWLFFVFVPYACLFILACVRAYVKDAELQIPGFVWLALALVFVAVSIAFRHLVYTGVVMASVAVALVVAMILSPASLRSRNFWLAMLLTYLPFWIANGILTGKPIVLYNDAENLSIRVGTIPLEDFFYSFSMLMLSFIVYDALGRLHGKAASIAPSTSA